MSYAIYRHTAALWRGADLAEAEQMLRQLSPATLYAVESYWSGRGAYVRRVTDMRPLASNMPDVPRGYIRDRGIIRLRGPVFCRACTVRDSFQLLELPPHLLVTAAWNYDGANMRIVDEHGDVIIVELSPAALGRLRAAQAELVGRLEWAIAHDTGPYGGTD